MEVVLGRKIFRFIAPVLIAISIVFKIIPKFILEWFWSLSNIMPDFLGVPIRYCILKRLSNSIGHNVYVGKYVIIKGWGNLSIGNNVSLHDFCYLDAVGGINIGSDVSIAHNVSIISFEHSWGDLSLPIKYNKTILNSINIDDDVWIGCGVRILSGSDIMKRVVVAAGSVTKGCLDNNSIYAGVPARLIKAM